MRENLTTKPKGPPIDINLPVPKLKKAIEAALNDKENYGIFEKNTKKWLGEMEVPIGDAVSLKWYPDINEGSIDVEGVVGKDMEALFGDFDKARKGLPPGRYILHPGEAKDAQGKVIGRKALKHKLYKRRFRNDPQITMNEDLKLRNLPGGSQESFTLDTNDYTDELFLSKRNKQGILETPKPKPSKDLLARAAALKKQAEAAKKLPKRVIPNIKPNISQKVGRGSVAITGGQAAYAAASGDVIGTVGRGLEFATDVIGAEAASLAIGAGMDVVDNIRGQHSPSKRRLR